jgi:hypothetical protein
MKKAIELLKDAKVEFLCVEPDNEESEESLEEGLRLLGEALAELRKEDEIWENLRKETEKNAVGINPVDDELMYWLKIFVEEINEKGN